MIAQIIPKKHAQKKQQRKITEEIQDFEKNKIS